MTCRKRRVVVETGLMSLARDKARRVPADGPSGDRHEDGVRPAQRLLCGTWEHCALMPRETSKWQTHEEQSTDAGCRDGRAVRAMKPGNAGRAKGPDSPAEGIGQPAMGGAGA
jgi:hypothetical protein